MQQGASCYLDIDAAMMLPPVTMIDRPKTMPTPSIARIGFTKQAMPMTTIKMQSKIRSSQF